LVKAVEAVLAVKDEKREAWGAASGKKVKKNKGPAVTAEQVDGWDRRVTQWPPLDLTMWPVLA
jgi:hypothetical protein